MVVWERDEVYEKYEITSILMFMYRVVMEVGGCLCLILICYRLWQISWKSVYFFLVIYFKDNMNLMFVMGVIYGVIRVIGAVGLWKNRMWGVVLSVINCVIAMALMMFMLPVGIMDGILATIALILILI